MLILTISHHIFLTKEERYAIHAGKVINVVGVSLPVWAEAGMTSEPAQEIFCEYLISNIGSEKTVTPTDHGYVIVLPKKTAHMIPRRPSDDEWRRLGSDEQQKWYDRNIIPISSKRLLDIEDGGCDGYLRFRYKTNMEEVPSFHFVEIKKIEDLLESIH